MFSLPQLSTVVVRFLAVAVLVLAADGASAKNLDIAAFFGKWQGHALSESAISVNFQLTSRDIGVEVGPDGAGFRLTWNTVQRQRGDPDNPTDKLKATSMRFQPLRAGVWRGVDAGDPLDSGRPYAWAYIKRQTLVVSVLQIHPEGPSELQIYRRTLTGGAMVLEFTRTVDGEPVRNAKGRLIKIAN